MQLIDVVKLSEKKCQYPIRCKLKYATSKNFVGSPIEGYDQSAINIALLTPIAAKQLCEVQNYLIETHGYGLLIYDAYRPKRAVQDFVFWAQQSPSNDFEKERKAKHYPNIEKSQGNPPLK